MKKYFLIGLLAVMSVAVICIAVVLANPNALVVHPKGTIAEDILELIITNISLMLLIIIPTYILLFVVVWKYCIKKNAKYDPNYTYGARGELLMWGLPSIIVVVMALITWEATYHLNPYKPIESNAKPITIQVVAMDWKWLFIYPEQGIATLNHFHIPEQTPIHFRLTADGAPMNSFWVPQLSGQIYSMTGMATQLHLMANEPGEYIGRAVEINGEGYSDMTFSVRSTSAKDFEDWITLAQKSSIHLTQEIYDDLVKPSINRSFVLFSEVEENLFDRIIHKYLYPTNPVL